MPYTSWLNCGTTANDATVGTVAWTNAANAAAIDAGYATCAAIGAATGQYIKFTNFGFLDSHFGGSLGNAIVQLEFEMTRHTNASGVTDGAFKFVKAGTITGNSVTAGATWTNGADTTDVLVMSVAATGTTITQADLVGVSTAGGVLSVAFAGAGTASLDGIRCRALYLATASQPLLPACYKMSTTGVHEFFGLNAEDSFYQSRLTD